MIADIFKEIYKDNKRAALGNLAPTKKRVRAEPVERR